MTFDWAKTNAAMANVQPMDGQIFTLRSYPPSLPFTHESILQNRMKQPTAFSYAGNKKREQKELYWVLQPDRDLRVCEPFAGTGRFSFLFGKDGECYLNDKFGEVANILFFANHPDPHTRRKFAEDCHVLHEREEDLANPDLYYQLRSDFNAYIHERPDLRSAMFLRLLNTCHGGMVRFGPNGFNMPHKMFLVQGRKVDFRKRWWVLKATAMKAARWGISQYDANAYLQSTVDELCRERKLDVIYCDPPYRKSGMTYGADFTSSDFDDMVNQLHYLWFTYRVPSIISDYLPVQGASYVHELRMKRMAYVKGTSKESKMNYISVIGDLSGCQSTNNGV